jgi:hypothetical protein
MFMALDPDTWHYITTGCSSHSHNCEDMKSNTIFFSLNKLVILLQTLSMIEGRSTKAVCVRSLCINLLVTIFKFVICKVSFSFYLQVSIILVTSLGVLLSFVFQIMCKYPSLQKSSQLRFCLFVIISTFLFDVICSLSVICFSSYVCFWKCKNRDENSVDIFKWSNLFSGWKNLGETRCKHDFEK